MLDEARQGKAVCTTADEATNVTLLTLQGTKQKRSCDPTEWEPPDDTTLSFPTSDVSGPAAVAARLAALESLDSMTATTTAGVRAKASISMIVP